MTLPDCKDHVDDNNGFAGAPPVHFHSEAYGLINKLTMVEGTRWLRPRSSAASPYATAKRGDEAIYYKTYAAPRNKLILLTNVSTRHTFGYRSFDIIMNNQIFMNKPHYS